MAFYKKSAKKRVMRGKKPASKAPATKAYVKAVVNRNIETKFYDAQKIESSSTTLASPMWIDDIMNAQQFTGTHQIFGQYVQKRGFHIRYTLHNNSDKLVFCRVLVMYNKIGRNYTAYRAGTDIFEDGFANYSTNGTLYDIQRKINKDRYTVLRDVTHKLGTSAAEATSALARKMWIPAAGKARYEQGANGPELNNLVVLVISARADNDVTLGDTIECTVNTTFYYKDA